MSTVEVITATVKDSKGNRSFSGVNIKRSIPDNNKLWKTASIYQINSSSYFPKNWPIMKLNDGSYKFIAKPSTRNSSGGSRTKYYKVRPYQNADPKNAKSVKVQELNGGGLVLAEPTNLNGKTLPSATKIGSDDKGYYILKSSGSNLNEKQRKDKFLRFITQTEYYKDRTKIIETINILEGVGINIFNDLKELLISNPEESLNKKFINPKKAVMGVEMKKRNKIKKQLSDITRLVYINRMFSKFKTYLKYLKRYDDYLVAICCYYKDNEQKQVQSE